MRMTAAGTRIPWMGSQVSHHMKTPPWRSVMKDVGCQRAHRDTFDQHQVMLVLVAGCCSAFRLDVVEERSIGW